MLYIILPYCGGGGDGVSEGLLPQYLVIFPYVSLSPFHLKNTYSFQTIYGGSGTVMKIVGACFANLWKKERKEKYQMPLNI